MLLTTTKVPAASTDAGWSMRADHKRTSPRVSDRISALQPSANGRRTAPPQDDAAAAEREKVGAILAEQTALARMLQAAGDPKYLYLQLGQRSTQAVLALYESGQLRCPAWTLGVLAHQHSRFLDNLRRWLSPHLGEVEPVWQSAFTALDMIGEAAAVYSVLTGLHMALRAQLEHDLPQVIAQTLPAEQTGDWTSCQADLSKLAVALRSALEQTLAATLAPYLPKWLARPGKRLLSETLALLMQRHVYDLGSQHLRAFACGVKLARAATASASAACVPPPSAPAQAQGGRGANVRPGPRPLTSLEPRAYESARHSAADAA